MSDDYETLVEALKKMTRKENMLKSNQLADIKDTFYTDYVDIIKNLDSKQQKECEDLIITMHGIRLNKLGKKIFLVYNDDNMDIANTSTEEKELCNNIKKLLLDFEKKYIYNNDK